MNKVKKTMGVSTSEVQLFDVIAGNGQVVYIKKAPRGAQTQFACCDDAGFLYTIDWDDDEPVLITREVEKPDEVEIISVAGQKVLVKDYFRDEVIVSASGPDFIVASSELIQAIKDVKGMD